MPDVRHTNRFPAESELILAHVSNVGYLDEESGFAAHSNFLLCEKNKELLSRADTYRTSPFSHNGWNVAACHEDKLDNEKFELIELNNESILCFFATNVPLLKPLVI